MAYSALTLRDDLAYAQQRYGFKQVILIGHSMGGILSRLQVTNSGRVIWNEVLGSKADRLYAEVSDNSLLKRALIFHANPTVKRVIFVCTPHPGSTLATGGIGRAWQPSDSITVQSCFGYSPIRGCGTRAQQRPTKISRPDEHQRAFPVESTFESAGQTPDRSAAQFHHWRPWPRRYPEQFRRRRPVSELSS